MWSTSREGVVVVVAVLQAGVLVVAEKVAGLAGAVAAWAVGWPGVEQAAHDPVPLGHERVGEPHCDCQRAAAALRADADVARVADHIARQVARG